MTREEIRLAECRDRKKHWKTRIWLKTTGRYGGNATPLPPESVKGHAALQTVWLPGDTDAFRALP